MTSQKTAAEETSDLVIEIKFSMYQIRLACVPGSADSYYTDFVVAFCAFHFKFNSQTERPRFDRTLHSEVNERYEIAFSLCLQFIVHSAHASFSCSKSGYREYRKEPTRSSAECMVAF